jgi:Kef-type K+ transport system membrane component KefB
MVAVFVIAIAAVLHVGNLRLGHARADQSIAAVADAPQAAQLWTLWRDHVTQPLPRLLIQIVIVILAARLFGAAARKLGQPSVIGEMAAGIALGPSLLGAVSPHTYQLLFASASLGVLGLLSQIGVILFMFIVGLDFDWAHVRHRAHAAVVISNVSIAFPFLLGTCTALALYATYAPAGISFRAFGLFMGIAMSITAFPVLARILEERRMLHSPVGSMALTCAAVGDVTAWTLLAFVVAVVTADGSLSAVAVTVAATIGFGLAMAFVVRPLLAPLLRAAKAEDELGVERLAIVMGVAFASALVTELIGIHALFGAFLAGATLPASSAIRARLRDRLDSFGSILLLPLFFAFTGLRTQVGLISDAASIGIAVAMVVVATIGKLGGSAVAARLTGMDWRNAFVLGALMNTRGLMELIALNVGYDLGVISPQVFTILVVMAFVTTAMTGPLVGLAQSRGLRPPSASTGSR